MDSWRGKFDEMRMQEGENIKQYNKRKKDVVKSIRNAGGKLEEDDVVSKILRTLLPQYVIRFSAIQELRSLVIVNVTLDSLIGKLVVFELSNYDNSMPKIDVAFKSSMIVAPAMRRKETKSSSTTRTGHSHEHDNLLSKENEQDELEALIARRLPRGKGKYRGKLHLKCFSCNKIGHIASRCPDNDRKDNFRRYKENRKKECYLIKGVTDEES